MLAFGAVDQMQDRAAAFGMAEESVAKPDAFMRAFDQARQIGQHEIGLVDAHHAELRLQRGEGIIGDLGPRRARRATRKVDLPALGMPISPASAISLSLRMMVFSSPGWPGLA